MKNKKLVMFLLLSLITVGCSSNDKKADVKTSDTKQEQIAEDKTTEENQNKNDADIKDDTEKSQETDTPKSSTGSENSKKANDTKPKQDISSKDKSNSSSKQTQTTNQSSTQSSSTFGSTSGTTDSHPSETKPVPPVENVVPDKQPEKQPEQPKNYKVGNCGKLYNTESEARAVADANNGTFTDTYFISGYFLYSTYDKWSFDYYYTYFE